MLLPEYLRERFVAAALSYITCSSEGELVCKENDCWCKCSPTFPECNCPDADIQAMEDSLLQIQDAWATHNRQFEESGEQASVPDFLPVLGEAAVRGGVGSGELSWDPGSASSVPSSRSFHHSDSQVISSCSICKQIQHLPQRCV